jgi:hypothetical protein
VTAGIGRAVVLAWLLAGQPGAVSADQFRHLSGEQIRARFAGKMLTDDTHWRETYQPGGRRFAEQMGGAPMTGTWRVDHDQLCTALHGVRDACYAVWTSGDRVELRHADSPTVEAFLRPPRQPPAH